jgi:hypothetical protein
MGGVAAEWIGFDSRIYRGINLFSTAETTKKTNGELIPMSGFNTEIEHNGSSFHVQTQDQGTHANCVESVIYKSGKVLSSRRTYYTSLLNNPALHNKIFEIVQEQHSAILKEITEGHFDHL